MSTAPTTPAARHAEALATLRKDWHVVALVYGATFPTTRYVNHAIRTLERHSWVIYSGDLCVCGKPWPCPDAQSVLDAIKEAGDV